MSSLPTPAAAAAAPAPAPALPALPSHPTRAMTALSLLAAQRTPVLRPGRTTNPARPANLEAELGQVTGQVSVPGCTHCAGGSGVWTVCVVVAGFFGGSCCNCHYGSEGARCSLRAPAAACPRPRPRLPRVAPGGRIVDRVAPGNLSSSRAFRRPAAAAVRRRRPRHTPSQRARRFARLYRELAALYEEEAEVLEEGEETDYSVPESEEEAVEEVVEETEEEGSTVL
ncbi:hypothetical protein B0J14DRAFT_236465 [Halenospora varia]|nr:hypothetical protein B0J14DRAFT_236465 [Halenospora varia]